MARAMISPKFYAWGRDGKPLAFGKVYTYQARTNSPKPTYQSEDQIVANTNPVILNGEGYANIYLDGAYKIVVKDSNDNEIWTADPVTQGGGDGDTYSQFTLTGYYSTPTEVKVLGDYTRAILEGMKITITSLGTNGKDQEQTSTVISSTFDESRTEIVVADPVITTSIKCVSVTNWPFEEIAAIEEFVESNDRYFVTPQGKIKQTVTGIQEIAVEQFNATFQSQFAYKRIGNISIYAGQSLAEAYKLNSYQYPDDSGEWYGPIQSQVFPITIPLNPSTDEGWALVSAATKGWVAEKVHVDDSQIVGEIWPVNSSEIATIGDADLFNVSLLREGVGLPLRSIKVNGVVTKLSGVITDLDFTAGTVTISGVEATLGGTLDNSTASAPGAPLSRLISDILGDRVNAKFWAVADYFLPGTTTPNPSRTDNTAGFEAMYAYAESIGKPVYIPAGAYYSRYLKPKVSTYGDGFYYKNSTVIYSDYDLGYVFDSELVFYSVENIAVRAFGAATSSPFGGFRLGSDATSPSTRYQYKNLYARDFASGTGISMKGWVGTANNLFVEYCGRGFDGDSLNGSDITIQVEECTDFLVRLTDCTAGRIKVLSENFHVDCIDGIVIDGGRGMNLDSPYLEFQNVSIDSPLVIGKTSEVNGLVSNGGSIFLSDAAKVSALTIDRVNGLDMSINIADGGSDGAPAATSYITNAARNIIRLDIHREKDDGLITAQNSAVTSPPIQYTPDPTFESYTAQFSDVSRNNATLSSSSFTTIGTRSIKVSANAAGLSFATFSLDYLLLPLTGQSIDVAAWVYVPDIPAYNGVNKSIPTIGVFDGVASKLAQYEVVVGRWNFIVVRDYVVDASATTLDFRAYPTSVVGSISDGTENIFVDALFIFKSKYSETKVMNFEFIQHKRYGEVDGINFIGRFPRSTSTSTNFEVGDTFNLTPIAGGYRKQVCVTSGTGATAVFKGVGLIEA